MRVDDRFPRSRFTSFARWVALACALTAGFAPGEARAQELECPMPDEGPLEFTPASGAREVTLDAFVKVRYSEDYFAGASDPESFVTLHEAIEGDFGIFEPGEIVPGTAQLVGDTVYYLPDSELDAGADYVVVAESFDFEPLIIDFRTGGSVDLGPPVLGRVRPPSTEVTPASCDREAGYRVDVVVEGVQDDGPDSSIDLLVYLARQEGLEAPELVLTERSTGSDEIPLGFVLSDARAQEPACLVVHAVDGVGNVDDDMEPVCFEPIQGAFFNGLCTASRVAGDGAAATTSLTAFALFLVGRRRRR